MRHNPPVLTRAELLEALARWEDAWNAHDLETVMALFADDVVFEHWHGARVVGAAALRDAWAGWFAEHGGFRFETEDMFVDEAAQKALYRWTLDWPSVERGREGERERRRGVDAIAFRDGLIVEKLTYSKTVLELDGQRVRLAAPPPQ